MIEPNEESKILVSIARLEEKYDKLDEDMRSVVLKIEECMSKSVECNQKTFKWAFTTVLSITFGTLGWIAYIIG